MLPEYPDLYHRVTCFLEQTTRPFPAAEEEFDRLALSLFQWQFARVEPYRNFCQYRGQVDPPHWSAIPAIPIGAFKECTLTSITPSERTKVFHSSGTTGQKRSSHFHDATSLALYERSLLPWFETHLLPPDAPGTRNPEFLFLAPAPQDAPTSSLVHMFAAIREKLGGHDVQFLGRLDSEGRWQVDLTRAHSALRQSISAHRPVALLTTAFLLVHLLDDLAQKNIRYRLPEGSRLLETGGYKGLSRHIPKSDLHLLTERHFGIARSGIISEYGMSELSSQAYDLVYGNPQNHRVFRFPHWARARVVSPESGLEVSHGETGLLVIHDLANIASVAAIQTEDLAQRLEDGFLLIGRASGSEQRGCSLMSREFV